MRTARISAARAPTACSMASIQNDSSSTLIHLAIDDQEEEPSPEVAKRVEVVVAVVADHPELIDCSDEPCLLF